MRLLEVLEGLVPAALLAAEGAQFLVGGLDEVPVPGVFQVEGLLERAAGRGKPGLALADESGRTIAGMPEQKTTSASTTAQP